MTKYHTEKIFIEGISLFIFVLIGFFYPFIMFFRLKNEKLIISYICLCVALYWLYIGYRILRIIIRKCKYEI